MQDRRWLGRRDAVHARNEHWHGVVAAVGVVSDLLRLRRQVRVICLLAMPPSGDGHDDFCLLMLAFSREELGPKGYGDYGGMAQLVRARAIAWAHADRAPWAGPAGSSGPTMTSAVKARRPIWILPVAP